MRTPQCAADACEECEVSFVSTCAENLDQEAGCHLVLDEEPRRAFWFFFWPLRGVLMMWLACHRAANGG